MNNKTLLNDIARCDGYYIVEIHKRYWREGCETCLRRTAPRPDMCVMMAPPSSIGSECPYLITPETDS